MTTGENIVRQLLEHPDDDVDPKQFVNDHLPKEIVVVGRYWWRRGYGGMYFSARIRIDGKIIEEPVMGSGSNRQYLYDAFDWLEREGYITHRERSANGGVESPQNWCEKNGVKLEYYSMEVKRERDL